ncbi:MAG: hypothetical protein DMG65_10535 [Candidatus Angelobacter sp. Gp1-AA117]|nr:MAG: hypothetical protein DMG65_10535 [Candidatus Angelobacter sp. Gp1-AA117]
MCIEFDRVLFLKALVNAAKAEPVQGCKSSMKSLQKNKNIGYSNAENAKHAERMSKFFSSALSALSASSAVKGLLIADC